MVQFIPVNSEHHSLRQVSRIFSHQLVLKHAEAPEKIDRVQEDAVGLTSDRAILHPYLHLRNSDLDMRACMRGWGCCGLVAVSIG